MSDRTAHKILEEIIAALDMPNEVADRVQFLGDDRLPSCFPVSELAAASIGAAGAALSALVTQAGGAPPVDVDFRLASLWFGWSIRPIGWSMPSPWDPIAGDYRCADGWIKLHTNAPHHRAAALSVLACTPEREIVAARVAEWPGDALEAAIVTAGGCAAVLRSRSDWAAHPQGIAVAGEPLVRWDDEAQATSHPWRLGLSRPLAGIRVLDLTRVLAGPVATRFLAGFGAEVLRIDPPGWDEPGVIPEVTLGKRCARLDLKGAADLEVLTALLGQTDVLIHGYRADALERLGLGVKVRQRLRPRLIDISLDAYGHCGPWLNRRGFDSLVQFSSGIAAAGMAWKQSEVPVSLPVQALDHATGYLLAAAAIRGLLARSLGAGRSRARLSLARTARLLTEHMGAPHTGTFEPGTEADFAVMPEQTGWGPALRLNPPLAIKGMPMAWSLPAMPLGSSEPTWAG